MKKIRKILAVILSIFMVMVSCCAPISGCAVTAAESENDSLYAGEGYEVEFLITDSWSDMVGVIMMFMIWCLKYLHYLI